MTVTELREALAKLEAEGRGSLPVIYWYTYKGDLEPCEVDDARLDDAPNPEEYWRLGFKTASPWVVTIR